VAHYFKQKTRHKIKVTKRKTGNACLSLAGKSFDMNFGRFFAHNEDLRVPYRSLNVIRQDVIGRECGVHGTEKNA
jgi:hypothetical protein